jgi:hypothetical protein
MIMSDRLPIHDLVEARSKELGIRRQELARRCGYLNVAKGIRRIEAMCAGDLESSSARTILRGLATALKVEQAVVDETVRETGDCLDKRKRMVLDEQQTVRRLTFEPNAYLIGSEKQPSSITIFGLSGGAEHWQRITLDCSRAPVTYATQALAVARRTPVVPFFGPTTGFIVNYTPNHAVRFDIKGNPVEVLNRAYFPEQVELQIGRRRLSCDSFGRIMGFT